MFGVGAALGHGVGGEGADALVLEEHGEEEADGPLAHDDGEIAGAGIGHPDGLDAGVDGFDEAGGVEGNAIGNQLDAAFDDPVHDADVLIDATCPLVTKVHLEAVKFAKKGYRIILIGHENHDEVVGTLGEAPDAMVLVQTVEDVDNLVVPDAMPMAYLTQTTLSLDETRDIIDRLRERFPRVEGPHSQDICYATENRQVAVKAVAPLTDLLLVVGSRNSSNSQRLVEVCRKEGRPAYLVDDEKDVRPEWFAGVNTVSITAGASAPEHLVESLISYLQANGFGTLETLEVKEEDVRFSLPPELNSAKLTQIRPAV